MSALAQQLGIDGDARIEAGQRSARHAHANARAAALITALQGIAGTVTGFASSGVAGITTESDFTALKASVATYLQNAATNITGLA